MTLTLQPLPDYVIDEGDFSQFVAETYGRPFRYQQMNMIGNDSYIEFDVPDTVEDDQEWVEEYAQPQLDEWIAAWDAVKDEPNDPNHSTGFKVMHAERNDGIDLEVIVWDLHRRGLIPAGSYLMKVSW